MKNFKLFILAILCASASVASASPDIKSGVPLNTPPLTNMMDTNGNDVSVLSPAQTAKNKKDADSQKMLAGTWFDSGAGPGTLQYQGQWYFSDILSTGFASGYMDEISYQWSGSFNGWTDVLVYLFILDGSGNIVANADVTNDMSDTIPVPPSTYPANYRLVFGYIVDRPYVARIYSGPTFGSVSASVYYQ